MGAVGVVRSSSSARMDVAKVAVVLRSLGAGTSTLQLRAAERDKLSQI